jgi:CDGSH-type Zn-finger protein
VADRTSIAPRQNGPYIVKNCRMLRSPLDGRQYATDGTVALCRCGGSKNKPYCDGTHARIGFSGAKAPDRVPDAREDYAGAQVTIHDNRGICAHAGKCTDTLATVFRLGQEPWIDPNGDTREQIVATVEQSRPGRSATRSTASNTATGPEIR